MISCKICISIKNMSVGGALFRGVSRVTLVGAKVGLLWSSVQLTSELGVWGRNPQKAAENIKEFVGINSATLNSA